MTLTSDSVADRRVRLALGEAAPLVEDALARLIGAAVPERIWRRDATVWSSVPAVQALISNRLGWLDVAARMRAEAPDLIEFGAQIRGAGFTRVVVLGMGGSSLCVEVMREVFQAGDGYPTLTVVDTTDPPTIRDLDAQLDYHSTMFVVASKSGGTLETRSHAAFFYARALEELGTRAGSHFIAITDSGSDLERLAREQSYRRVFINPSDIGGRYSVLSYFGLVPAALAGIDIANLLDRALAMMEACQSPGPDNPGLQLGALLGALALAGRDKATLVMAREIRSFGDWAEQLIAESTGKQGRGVIPVTGEDVGEPHTYGNDRVFVHLYLRSEESLADVNLEHLEELAAEGQPLMRLELDGVADLAGEFFRWEFATAVAGHMLGVNPFDEPNVQESKDNTSRLLARFEATGTMPEPVTTVTYGRLGVVGTEAADDAAIGLRDFLARVGPGDYVALLAYIRMDATHDALMAGLRALLRERLRAATTVGYGPRFLHSTGQLHKGGPGSGVFLQLVAPAADGEPVPIPGRPYDFGTLKAAQALGDFESLQAHERRVVRVDLGPDVTAGLTELHELLDAALSRSASQ